MTTCQIQLSIVSVEVKVRLSAIPAMSANVQNKQQWCSLLSMTEEISPLNDLRDKLLSRRVVGKLFQIYGPQNAKLRCPVDVLTLGN